MRPLCDSCEVPTREGGSYPAFEGDGEVHVAVWVCPRCGGLIEETAPPPEAEPAADRRVA